MPKIIATCHCGGTKLELPEAPAILTQCTCTYCTKSGGIWCYYEVDEVRVVAEGNGAIYSPTSALHEHHFCARCGCTTYGITPDYPLEDTETPEKKKVGVNAKLFDDYALLVSLPVGTIDGRNLW